MSPRLLEVFNRYREVGGEETAANAIHNALGTAHALTRCTFSSTDWDEQGVSAWKQAQWMWRNPEALAKLTRLDEGAQPDAWLLHNIFPVGSAAIYELALQRQRPIVQYIHNFRPYSVNGYLWAGDHLVPEGLRRNFLPEIWAGSWQQSRLKTAWYAGVLWRLHRSGWLRSIRAWVAISQFMKDRFVEAGVPAQDVFVVPHFYNMQLKPPSKEDDGYYLFLGRLTSAKGITTLLDAWLLLHERLGSSCPRLIVAGDGPMGDFVKRHCEGNAFCRYAGQVSGTEKEALLRGCRGMIVPSVWWEPFGLVTCEAYDFAKPVFAARSGALTETVDDGITGCLHEPGNAAQLAEHIFQADANPTRRQEMGLAGHHWLKENGALDLWRERIGAAFAHALR